MAIAMFSPVLIPSFAVSLCLLTSCSGESEPSAQGPAGARSQDAALPPEVGEDLLLRTRREKRVPGKPEWIHSLDLDGSGTRAVLVSTNSPGALMIWRGPGAETEGLIVGDYPLRPMPLWRGEGRAPLIGLASRREQSLVLYDLSEPGAPQTALELELDDLPMVIAEGVIDSRVGHELLVFTRNGSLLRVGEEGVRQKQQLASSWPRSAFVLEPDVGLVVGFQGSDRLEFYRASEGAQELEHRGGYQLPATARDLLGLDLDGDGDQELIAVAGDESGWIFGLRGSALFGAEAEPQEFATTAIPIRLRPLPDRGPAAWIVLAAKGVACEQWEMGPRGPQRFGFTIAGQTPVDTTLADYDGDGREDFWVANRDAHTISILRTDEGGPISPGMVKVGAFPNDIATGDIDGDGPHEAFVIDAKDLTISVLKNTGGRFVNMTRIRTGSSPRAVACVDIDGDQWLDLVWLERVFAETRLNVRLGDGQGGLHRPEEFEPLPFGVGARDFVVESFNGDPRRFLVAADPDGRRLLWTEVSREGARLLLSHRGELSLPHPPRAIASLRHDGVLRGIAVTMPVSVARSLVQVHVPLATDEGGISWRKVGETTISGYAVDIGTGDLDGDGTYDIVVLASDREGTVGARVAPLLLRGGNMLQLGLLKTGLRPQRVLAEDFTGDGLAEIFVANLDTHNVNAWLAVATEEGLAFRALDDVGAGVGCIALAVPDLNGDGISDLMVVDSANDGVSLIVNETQNE
jgi:hypothetical protein